MSPDAAPIVAPIFRVVKRATREPMSSGGSGPSRETSLQYQTRAPKTKRGSWTIPPSLRVILPVSPHD
jgi:hypothetical protein